MIEEYIKCPHCQASDLLWEYRIADEKALEKKHNKAINLFHEIPCEKCNAIFKVRRMYAYDVQWIKAGVVQDHGPVCMCGECEYKLNNEE